MIDYGAKIDQMKEKVCIMHYYYNHGSNEGSIFLLNLAFC